MILLIKNFMDGFISRSGNAIFISTVLSRILSFIGSMIALRLLDNKELGVILFAYSIIQFMIPIGGFGLHQSLLRYGALLASTREKEKLFSYVLKHGIIGSLILIIIVLLIGWFISFQFDKTFYYLCILSTAILSNFIFELVKTQFRLQHKNNLFAKAEFFQNFLLVVLIFSLTNYLGGLGYVIALISAPFITAILFVRKLQITFYLNTNLSITNVDFWKYGFFGGLSNVVTQLLFIIDLILIGELMTDPLMVTHYKYISIIPFSLLFLPRVFMAADFVSLTEKIGQKVYIRNYIKSYQLFFSLLSLLIFSISCFFSKSILLLFGKEYVNYSDSFVILIFGITGIFIFRGIYGNLLSSIGKMSVNYYIVSIAILINILSNFYLIPIYGIKGAAITSSILMWLTGIASWVCFNYLYKKKLLKRLSNVKI
ncbi:MAG: oligosaccharide flippase family protein [Flavobacteriaceae bacterium]|nr:oligosaccharide flippase family protein [Flavobacteriaceae bacterium]MDG2275761.1 oligosaccharide flippase family protein [Flavobacteriaceae bacterium]